MEIKRHAQRERRETGEQHTSMELSYEKPLKDDDYDLVWYYRITQIPTFVIITVPEVKVNKIHKCQINLLRLVGGNVIFVNSTDTYGNLCWRNQSAELLHISP